MKTTYGTVEKTRYDEWDRPVKSISGLSDGRFRAVGSESCGSGAGAIVERAYDAAETSTQPTWK